MNTAVFDLLLPEVLERSAHPCSGRTELFYPEDSAGVEVARAICRTCPNVTPCLRLAIVNGEEFGIWGGTSGRERIKLISLHRRGLLTL